MRRGEICGLYDTDIKGDVVHVIGNMVRYTSKRKIGINDKLFYDSKWLLKRPKSYNGDRFIKYPDYVRKLWEGRTGRIVDLCPDMITDRFGRLIKRIGLPHFRFHDLRHYSASIQHALGIKDAYIMSRAGWNNDRVLKEVYRHALNDKQEEMDNVANQHFDSLVVDNDSLSLELPESFNLNDYVNLLYQGCKYIVAYKIVNPEERIQNFSTVLESVISHYGLCNYPGINEGCKTEAIHAFKIGSKEMFMHWIPTWFETLRNFN